MALTLFGFSLWVLKPWLGGKTKGKERTQALERIASGQAQMVVGTHALFQQQVQFANLALIIIDEQHCFGVHQRLALREKGKFGDCYPHQLVMTATPIPRTLAMTAYADLETSIIDELPPDVRLLPLWRCSIPPQRGNRKSRARCSADKRQVYWVCTLIDESEALQCQAAEDTAKELAEALPELAIALVHGRMKAAEKQAIMDDFTRQNRCVSGHNGYRGGR